MPPDTDPAPAPLARLEALLRPATYTRAQYARALAQAQDNVPRAAEWLLTGAIHVAAPRTVAEWIKPAALEPEVVCLDDSQSEEELKITTKATKRRRIETNPTQQKDFLARFTPQQDRTPPARRPPERALNLPTQIPSSGQPITPSHLPTISLHASPIPHPLACALYHELLAEAESFERHEWFLAGRRVSAPHTSGYYHDEVLEREDARGAAEDGSGYWYAGKKVRPAPVRSAAHLPSHRFPDVTFF